MQQKQFLERSLYGSSLRNKKNHLKESEREEQTKPKVRRKKEITKIREEIKKIQIEKAIEEIKLRDGSLKG